LLLNLSTARDVFGTLRAVAAFPAVLLAPGYCLAWATNLLDFRGRSLGERLAWGVVVSFAGMPLLAVEVGKYVSLSIVCWLCGLCTACLIAIVVSRGRTSDLRRYRTSGWIALAWLAFVVLELVDIGVGAHLYLSVTVFDNALRTSFVDATLRSGVPPVNPLYWPGHAAPMRYYYFWYVLTALAARLGHGTARQAIVASVSWAGVGLASVLALYCRHFLPQPAAADVSLEIRRRRWPRVGIALALLAVTGLDIIPVTAMAAAGMPVDPDMEWWSPDKVSSWMDSLLWVPHHIAGLVCCLAGFLLVWMSKGRSRGQQVLCSLLAGLSFASAFGLSTWVAVAFAKTMAVWLLWSALWLPASRSRVLVLAAAGVTAVIALSPFLSELRGEASGIAGVSAASTSAGTAPTSHLLRLGIRHLIESSALDVFPWCARLASSHPHVERILAGLFLLLPGYVVELGFYGGVYLTVLLAARAAKLDEAVQSALVLTGAGLLFATFVRSTVIAYNDFGMRSVLIPQFFLLLLAVLWCEGAFPVIRPWRIAMQAMLWIGLAGTVYQAIELRLYLPVEERLGRPEEIGLAERAMALRHGFDAMDCRIPKDAVVQYDLDQPSDYFRYAQIMQVRRQTASALPECGGSAFGGDPEACAGISAAIGDLFPRSAPAPSASEAEDLCRKLGVDHLIATRWDKAWSAPGGWVWNLPAVVDTGDVRVVACESSGLPH
jgi:hypothetical protein